MLQHPALLTCVQIKSMFSNNNEFYDVQCLMMTDTEKWEAVGRFRESPGFLVSNPNDPRSASLSHHPRDNRTTKYRIRHGPDRTIKHVKSCILATLSFSLVSACQFIETSCSARCSRVGSSPLLAAIFNSSPYMSFNFLATMCKESSGVESISVANFFRNSHSMEGSFLMRINIL